MADLQGPQVAVTRELLVEPAAPPAVDAPVHLVLDKASEELVPVGPLEPPVAPEAVASGHGHVLKKAVAALVADRAVVGMVEHEPLHDVAAEVDRLLVRGRHNHAIGDVDHAAHLDPFDRAVDEFHGAHPACPGRP